jgi:hypothetical protein
MGICGAIFKYSTTNFSFYILESFNENIPKQDLSERENYWYKLLKPSYNIQDILQPFTGSNHYRFCSKV